MDLQSPPLRHLLFVYSKQLESEQSTKNTHAKNGVGFTRFDAPLLTSLAQQVLKGKTLSERQTEVLLNRLRKYHKQTPPEDFDVLTVTLQPPQEPMLIE